MERAPDLPEAVRAGLEEVYRPEIERLQELLGRDLSGWGAARSAGDARPPAG
jgi:hypothetical protein